MIVATELERIAQRRRYATLRDGFGSAHLRGRNLPLASAGNFTFNFPDTLLNTATPFSMTNNGVTVSFSSPADPGGFVVYPSFFSFNNNVLFDPAPAGQNSIPLSIGIDTTIPIQSISMDFALNAVSGTSLDFTAYQGSTQTGSGSAVGNVPGHYYIFPEGILYFSGSFNKIVLSSPRSRLCCRRHYCDFARSRAVIPLARGSGYRAQRTPLSCAPRKRA